MTLDLNTETREALVDELKRHIKFGGQKRIAIEVANELGITDSTGESLLSRLMNKREGVLEQLLGPEHAEAVLGAICRELRLDIAELVRTARKAAKQRPRPAPDRHPAWQDLGEPTPWVDKVPGLRDGTETLRRAISAYGQRVVWLVGPAGSGKSARLWRAQQAKVGRLVDDQVPDETESDAVWLVDEPADPTAWIAGASRCKARLIIATRAAKQRREGESTLELSTWTHAEVESFLGQIGDARRVGPAALVAVDLDHIADKLNALGRGWTPLELGHLIRLLVDEPALLDLDANDRELHIRSAMHGMLRRAELSPDHERLWSERGRQACALAAAAAVCGSSAGRPIGPVSEDALREALAELAGITVGGKGGEPLRAILERARRESRKGGQVGGGGERDKGGDKVIAKKVLQKLEAWACSPSSDDLIELLVELGTWQRVESGTLALTDADLALTLAAERLGDDWMWRRLRDTLVDPDWANARIAWAPCLGRVEERIDELLATDAVVHIGAIELAAAMVAFAREVPRPDQVERAVCSAARLLECELLTRLGISPIPTLRDVVRSASRRHLRTLPPVTTALTRRDLAERCTESTRRIVRAADRLAEDGPEWLRARLVLGRPEWVTYAELMPWQALPALQEPAGRELLRFASFDRAAVLMDHAADGHVWARAVATCDVENIHEIGLVSSRGLLRALGQWPAPSDPRRHLQALAVVLNGLRYGNDATRARLHSKVVRAIVDFLRCHPEHPLPDFSWLRSHEASWREALDQVAAVHHLRAWFDSERQELLPDEIHAPTMSSHHKATPSQLSPAVSENIGRLVRLGEALHRHGVPEPLRGLLALPEQRAHIDRAGAVWELSVGAADALLRLRDASLRSLREPYGSVQAKAVSHVLSRESHDEETVLWIADHLGDRYNEVLESIVGRPERREVARRWALDASLSFRRHAAAHWLLSHPAIGDCEHVRWVFTELPVRYSLDYVSRALAHPDKAIGAAAIALLPRALEELGADADLASVARSFVDPRQTEGDSLFSVGAITFAMRGLDQYLREVNASEYASNRDSIRTLIVLLQRCFATISDEQVRELANGVCSSLATAARRLRLDSLATWVRAPLGDHADDSATPSRIAAVRSGIISGISGIHRPGWDASAELDSDVLLAVIDTSDPREALWAHTLLLERASLTEAQLFAEWNAVSDDVLVDLETAPARFIAVRAQLRRQAPRALARALADRLLVLPRELRRFGISQIWEVVMLDTGQAERLSPLFD